MTELVDLVDNHGYIQVETVPRSEIDEYPGLHLQIAVAVIFSGLGNVLVQKRSFKKEVDRGRLDFVCGAVISGEDPISTVRRESLGETGVIPLRLRFISRGVNLYGRYKHFFLGYAESEQTNVLNSHEAEWARFLPPNSFDRTKPQLYVDDFFYDLDVAKDYLGN